MKKSFFCCIMMAVISLGAFAQSGTNSPYSQYGLGILSDQSQGANRGMNGLAIGLRYSDQVNTQNPASYSAVDSLTMIFDVGLSGQITNFKEGGNKVNAKNADFEYAVALFRVKPNLGVSLGVIPYTNVGYKYSNSEYVGTSDTYTIQTYQGEGGIHQGYVGIGWRLFDRISLGANISYLWGNYSKTVSVVSSDNSVNTETRLYSADISSYKIDFGAQYEQKLSKKYMLVAGATFGLGHKLGADPYTYTQVVTANSQTPLGDTIKNGLSIPMTFGVGLSLCHSNNMMIGVDYSCQHWGKEKFPRLNETTRNYELASGLLRNRSKMTVGGEWIPKVMSRKFYERIHYRLGAAYATPYYNIGTSKGPKEISVSAGVGVPIVNAYNNRSLLNVSVQWVNQSAANFIKENSFRINVGLTFNERWFAKWKVD